MDREIEPKGVMEKSVDANIRDVSVLEEAEAYMIKIRLAIFRLRVLHGIVRALQVFARMISVRSKINVPMRCAQRKIIIGSGRVG